MKTGGSTLNTPYAAGLTGVYNAGIAYINMTGTTYGSITYYVIGQPKMYLASKSAGTWSGWNAITTNADIASKSTNLTPGGGYTVLSWFGCFAVISGGSCYLQIGLTSTTPTIASSKSIICTLPTQYRPVRKYIQHTDWGDFVVDTDGTIYIGNTTSSLLHNKNITINAAFLT